MKKFLSILLVIFCLLSSSAQAKTIKTIQVIAMENFSTESPTTNFRVKIINNDCLPDGTELAQGAIVSGHVSNITHAKRLKQDGYFEFIPNEIVTNKHSQQIAQPLYVAKVVDYVPLDPKQIVGSVAKTAAGYIVKGATQGISFVQGVVDAQNGERIKSGFTKVYKDSPLSYIDEGSELNVKIGDTLVLVIKDISDED